jgi:GxxExxY protein
MEQGGLEEGRHRKLSGVVIGACVEVHRHLGPGLLESAYETCLVHELEMVGLEVERQRVIPLRYKGLLVDGGYRVDLIVEGRLIVEVKAVEKLLPVHEAQLITYLKLTGLAAGLLINFHVPVLRAGIRRLYNASLPPFLPVNSSSTGRAT